MSVTVFFIEDILYNILFVAGIFHCDSRTNMSKIAFLSDRSSIRYVNTVIVGSFPQSSLEYR